MILGLSYKLLFHRTGVARFSSVMFQKIYDFIYFSHVSLNYEKLYNIFIIGTPDMIEMH